MLVVFDLKEKLFQSFLFLSLSLDEQLGGGDEP